ncbi:hypothetical protein N300_03174, partial [Calypte anna]
RMSGHGKKHTVAGKSGVAPKKNRSAKAGLQFPVGRIYRLLKKGKYTDRVSPGAAIYLTAVLEYLSAEILELSGNAAQENKRSRILPRHILLAVRGDGELNQLFSSVTIPQGGVTPNILSQLLPKKSFRDAGPSQ